MDGLVFTIDKLGRALAQAEQENAVLRQRVSALEAEKEQREQDSPASPPSA